MDYWIGSWDTGLSTLPSEDRSGASVAFEEGWIALHQVLGARRGGVRAVDTRETIYTTPWRATTGRAS